MSKTKIFIAVIAIAAIGIAAVILASSRSPVSPGVSEETGGGTEPVSETKAPEGTSVAEEAPSEKIEYEVIAGVGADGIKRGFCNIITGKLTEEQAKTLAEKIIKDITTKDSSLKEISLFFYSDKSSAAAEKYDVAQVSWVPNEITVRMKGN